jgi:hypothetical protein
VELAARESLRLVLGDKGAFEAFYPGDPQDSLMANTVPPDVPMVGYLRNGSGKYHFGGFPATGASPSFMTNRAYAQTADAG